MQRRGARRSYEGRWISPRSERSAVLLRVGGSYALLASVATGLVFVLRDGPPWSHPDPWLNAGTILGLTLSAALGITFALCLVGLTRIAVSRYGWARELHRELRPVARDLTPGGILLVAGLSSLGEELLFRGLLTPLLGVPLSALLFGFAHQIKGASRWVWVAWAAAVGLTLGAIFRLTGSLVGPLLAHAIINAVNLTYLRDHDPDGAAGSRSHAV